MRHWPALVLLLAAVPAFGQQSQIPDAGPWIHKTGRQHLTDQCAIGLRFSDKQLVCVPTPLLSISRDATTFNVSVTDGPVLSCPSDGRPCLLTYDYASTTVAYADWIMPSEAMAGKSLLLSWTSAATTGGAVWTLDYCSYVVGEPACTPTGAMVRSVSSPVNIVAEARNDAIFSPWPWPTTWAPDVHVVLSIRRDGYAPATGDTMQADAFLSTLRLEFTAE